MFELHNGASFSYHAEQDALILELPPRRSLTVLTREDVMKLYRAMKTVERFTEEEMDTYLRVHGSISGEHSWAELD